MPIHALRNPVKHYEWGSRSVLPEWLGEPAPAAEPWAELWIGSHPRGISEVEVGGAWVPLGDWAAEDPSGRLGADVVERFGPALPFLLKLLAVERPLSLQAHPDAARAAEGFAREEAAGTPLGAPERRYADPHPKPELVCALTRFEVLCGVRSPEAIAATLRALGAEALLQLLEPGLAAEACGRDVIGALLRTPRTVLGPALAELGERVASAKRAAPEHRWVLRLLELHPEDAGAAAPLLLHYAALEPGDALFLAPGELHTYLGGLALELQASSDNVLRGGLTPKHVDVVELLAVLARDGVAPVPIRERAAPDGWDHYPVPTDRFALSVVHVTGDPVHAVADAGLELLLCSEGSLCLEAPGAGPVTLTRGRSAVVAAGAGTYRISGPGTLYRATAGVRARP